MTTPDRPHHPAARRRDAAAAMRSDLDGQVSHVTREAGVRQRL